MMRPDDRCVAPQPRSIASAPVMKSNESAGAARLPRSNGVADQGRLPPPALPQTSSSHSGGRYSSLRTEGDPDSSKIHRGT
jgi:hypothetical protein